MNRQKSFLNTLPTLYLVATPIGNLDDMTFRAVKILESVDVIFCEDTRVSIKLLNHFEIKKPLKTYHDFNKIIKSDAILSHLDNNQNVALISDAGYPLISDPGYYVIREVIKKGYNVVSIPGANALLTALVTSGITPHPFLFYGFLDSKDTKKTKELEALKDLKQTLIFYESPHRINKTIKRMYDVLGNRKMTLSRELTKKFEEIIRGTTETLQDITDIKGEMVLVVEGNIQEDTGFEGTIEEELDFYSKEGMTSKDAIKTVAKNRKLPKNDVYMIYHENTDKE
jgi:16S rRNA (cytidine1402-2'-O)-methyltransferase